MSNLERLLKTCGKGWFVCKLYYELIDNHYLAWDKDKNLKNRENAYKHINKLGSSVTAQILKDIKTGKSSIKYKSNNYGRIISNKEIILMVDELLESMFLVYKGKIKKTKNITKRILLKDYRTPQTGPDNNGYHIRYGKDITDEEKIPGLCRYLEGEYERILGFAGHAFGEKSEMGFSRIPVILSKELPAKIYHNSDENVARMIKFLVERHGKNIAERDIIDIISNRDKIMSVTGMYFPVADIEDRLLYTRINNNPVEMDFHDGVIKIYYKNFNTTDLEEYKAMVAQTLAHEYMHYIQRLIGCKGSGFIDFSEIVDEADADFFSVMYSIYSHRTDRKIVVASERYKEWLHNFGSNWPYASALWFLFISNKLLPFSDNYNEYENNGCINKLVKVVLESKRDYVQAYAELTC